MNNKSALAAEVILKLLKLRKQAVFLTHLWSGFFMPYKGSEHVGIITLSVNAQVHAEMFSFCPNISCKFGLMKMKDFFRMIIPPSNVFFFFFHCCCFQKRHFSSVIWWQVKSLDVNQKIVFERKGSILEEGYFSLYFK